MGLRTLRQDREGDHHKAIALHRGGTTMKRRYCPQCGKPIPEERLGLKFTPLKARIFDAINRAGPDGISGYQLVNDLNLPVTQNTLKAHIWQINEQLAEVGKHI